MASGIKTTLSTVGLKKLRAQVGKSARILTIGVHEGKTADVDNGNIKQSVPIAPYAAANEFGTSRIPSRPFLQNTMKRYGKSWEKYFAVQLKRRGNDIEGALNDVGNAAAKDVVQTIKEGNFEPLKPRTIEAKRRKGRTEPEAILQDTESLIGSIGYEVT